jgi:hypothetical protein
MTINIFDTMTFDQAVGAIMIASVTLLSIAGLIRAGVESERS